jgi:hypothetical protein
VQQTLEHHSLNYTSGWNLLVRQQAKSLHAGDRKINGKPETGWRYTVEERRMKTEAETRPLAVLQSQLRRAEAFGAKVVGQAANENQL